MDEKEEEEEEDLLLFILPIISHVTPKRNIERYYKII